MIKKLQRKIFLILVTVLTLILLSALYTINSVNHRAIKKQTTEMMDKLMQLDTSNPVHGHKFKNNAALASAQYYVIFTDEKGSIRHDHIISNNGQLTDEEISKFASSVLSGDTEYMRYEHMAYQSALLKDKTEKIVLLDTALADENRLKLIIISLSVAAAGIIVICIFSALLAKSLVKPVRENFENQKNFISDVSHEIKTPLAVITANAEMLERETGENKWLSYILEETTRMNSLVTSLLTLSEADSKAKDELWEDVDISICAVKTAMVFESIAFEHKVEIMTDISPDIHFKGCKDQIQQLFTILIDNAVNHSTEGTVVNFSLMKTRKKIIISVSNTGEPIPEEERDKIFERFYKLDKSRNRDSNHYGLGLAIAKSIVLQHNGAIGVDCDNKVTTFTVTFQSSK